MIIKKIFYQVAKDSDWEVGLIFECVGTMSNQIVDKNGDILMNTPFSTREPINEHKKIEI